MDCMRDTWAEMYSGPKPKYDGYARSRNDDWINWPQQGSNTYWEKKKQSQQSPTEKDLPTVLLSKTSKELPQLPAPKRPLMLTAEQTGFSRIRKLWERKDDVHHIDEEGQQNNENQDINDDDFSSIPEHYVAVISSENEPTDVGDHQILKSIEKICRRCL